MKSGAVAVETIRRQQVSLLQVNKAVVDGELCSHMLYIK